MQPSLFRVMFPTALLLASGCATSPATEPDRVLLLDAGAGPDAATPMDAALDASALLTDACLANCGSDASADASASDAASADAEAPLVFVPSYGPCPAPLSCDPLMAFIARPLILAAYPDAPSNVSACVPPNLAVPAVPACYEEGPCEIRGQVGICLGRKPPDMRTGYCIKPCT